MEWEDLKAARDYLDELESGKTGKERLDWLKSQKAWLTLSIIDEIAKDKVEQQKVIEGVVAMLKEAQTINP
jgi:hypothetical protein